MKATLVEYRTLSPDVRHFVFEASEPLHFVPGQFVSFTESIHGQEFTRAYSLASAPGKNNRFELCLNHVPDGAFSSRLFAMKAGESLEMRPPLGAFTLLTPPKESILVATGTGIAPFRSMLQAHLTDTSPPFTLIFGARYEHGLVYRDEFEEMARRFPRFHFIPVLSQPDAAWRGATGRVQATLRQVVGDRRDLNIYLCGLKAMVNETRAMLKEMGFDRKHILSERYD
jgi:ferredoxin-NADP reductase